MPMQELTLKSLADLDNGRISEAFQQKLRFLDRLISELTEMQDEFE